MTKAVAVLAGTEGRHYGNVFFTAEADGSTKVTVDLHDLTPGLHGFHIHALGDTTNGCLSTGIHFNPYAKEHGDREGQNRHAGDLGNIEVGEHGTVSKEFIAYQIPLSGPNSILGRAVVVHEDRDDLGKGGNSQSKIDGNSGARVACGVIALQA